MNKRKSTAKLGRTKSHRESMIQNQLRSLFAHGYVVTTSPKAKVLKQKTESFMHKAEGESLQVQRLLHKTFAKEELVKKTKEYLKNGDKKVSIVKVSFRDGDSAEMSKITLLGYSELFTKKKTSRKSKKKGAEKKGKTEVVEEKKDDKVVEKGRIDKGILNIKDRFVNKERARSRSGI